MRESLDGSDGHDIAFEEGSIERGRRVKVGSISEAVGVMRVVVEVASLRETLRRSIQG